jgi:integrase
VGALVEPSKKTVADYMRSWLATASTLSLSPKTAERYAQLIENQIVPYIGAFPLQRLKPLHIADWHAKLLRSGGHDGGPLKARTAGHAFRVLHKGLEDAVKHEVLARNPAAVISPPKVDEEEIEILPADQVKAALTAIKETPIYSHIVMLLSTGMRRGELMGLKWSDIDFDARKLRIDRTVEKTTAHGLRLKQPKTRHGRRTITLPDGAVEVLKEHRKAQLELRLALGLGRPAPDSFVFGTIDGQLRDPDRITQDWKRFADARGLPRVTLHAFRHSHASALIAAGADLVNHIPSPRSRQPSDHDGDLRTFIRPHR